MNMKPYIITAALSVAASATAQNLEFWNFDDAAGTDLNDLSNSGSLGSAWNFNTTAGAVGGAGHVTNGAGLWVIDGGTSTFTRKLPDGANEDAGPNNKYASPITTGAYRLEVNFASWDVTDFAVGDSWRLAVNDADSGSNTLAQVIFEKDSATTVRLRAATYLDDTSGAYRNFSYGITETGPISLALDFDFDNNTVSYILNGSETHSFTNFGGIQIAQLSYVTAGTWGNTGGSISIDSMGLSAIPEPSSFALLAGALALCSVMIRRRK